MRCWRKPASMTASQCATFSVHLGFFAGGPASRSVRDGAGAVTLTASQTLRPKAVLSPHQGLAHQNPVTEHNGADVVSLNCHSMVAIGINKRPKLERIKSQRIQTREIMGLLLRRH